MVDGGDHIQKDHVYIPAPKVIDGPRRQRFERPCQIVAEVADGASIKRRQAIRFGDSRFIQHSLKSRKRRAAVPLNVIGGFDLIFLPASRQDKIGVASDE